MTGTTYGIGEGPATRVSLSLPEGTAEAIRARVGKREFSGLRVVPVGDEEAGAASKLLTGAGLHGLWSC
ncbi:hypothetical protein [Streptomyces beigongshangae]|uniref:hypothetical protein n=1 Tax=Streptomyces beigongshangae TaxID=2841597 RepID=UPI001C848308|nr:hypothetical protein [Streptomyces sp. REN17]